MPRGQEVVACSSYGRESDSLLGDRLPGSDLDLAHDRASQLADDQPDGTTDDVMREVREQQAAAFEIVVPHGISQHHASHHAEQHARHHCTPRGRDEPRVRNYLGVDERRLLVLFN